MTVQGLPLVVRIVTGTHIERNITLEVRDLTFRSVAVGGFASASFSLTRPLYLPVTDVAIMNKIYVQDARNGKTVWQGYIEDPGRASGSDGTVWTVNATGPSARAKDVSQPYIITDSRLTAWRRAGPGDGYVLAGGNVDVADDPSGTMLQALKLELPQGTTVGQNNWIGFRYWPIHDCYQKIARVDWYWRAGINDPAYALQTVTRQDGGNTGEVARTVALTTSGGFGPALVVTNFPNGRNTVDFRIIRTGAGTFTIGNGNYWASGLAAYVVAMRYNADGTEITTPASYGQYCKTSDVVADMLGRPGVLTAFDGAHANITVGTTDLAQLAYDDPVTPAGVLDDLMVLEPGFRWGAWEDTAAGTASFEWVPWPTTVRYRATPEDGFRSSESGAELWDSVLVRFRDNAGNVGSRIRTQTVPELQGVHRMASLDLGSEVGTAAQADTAGDQFLADHRYPANAGTLTIASPIVDNTLGRMVYPWEIRPATLIRVRGINPHVDYLNPTRNGVTTFRIVSTEFSAATGATTCELDSYPPTLARSIASLRNTTQRLVRRKYGGYRADT